MSGEFEHRVANLKERILGSTKPWNVPIPVNMWRAVVGSLQIRVIATQGKPKEKIVVVTPDTEEKTNSNN